MSADLETSAYEALRELLCAADLRPGQCVVIGCSTSEVMGKRIGTAGTLETAHRVLDGLLRAAQEREAILAVQCCEHLNRALVLPRAALEAMGLTQVSALPHQRAGGSLATAYYAWLEDPALAMSIQAAAALDIGDTLIGMHLQPVAVPVRLAVRAIGQAHLTAARSRPPLIGGARARYPQA